MQPDSNKKVVKDFLLEVLGELDPEKVDDFVAPDHALSSPEFGTQVITGTAIIETAIAEFRDEVGEIEITIHRQIEEDEWVATSYTLGEASVDHMGILLSRVVAGKIKESFVVARTESVAEVLSSARKAFN